jgi:hypothetical protein
MATLTIHTENSEQLNALKAFMKAFKIKFEVSNDNNSELVSYAISQADQDLVLTRLNESPVERYSSIDKLELEINLQKICS